MKNSISINVCDFMEMRESGKILCNQRVNASSHKDRVKNELGFMNCDFTNTPDFCILESETQFYNNVNLFGCNDSVFMMSFILEGNIEHGFKNITISESGGKNNLGYYNADDSTYSRHRKGVNSKVFEIILKNDTLKGLSNKYPDQLEAIYNNFLKKDTFQLSENFKSTTAEMLHILSQIKNAAVMGNSSNIYIEAKVQELLFLQLQQASEIKKEEIKSKSKDIEKIYEAKEVLLANLQETPTIVALSKHVGINECKLKYGFKEVYKQTIFECLFNYKMELARKLLLDTNRTIADIAFDCGYSHGSHFIAAFRKKHGVTPNEFRKRA